MSEILGRTADLIVTPGGNRLIVHFFTGILEHFPQISQFQVVQDSADHLLLRVVPSGSFGRGDAVEVISALRNRGLDDMEIDLESVAEIPLSSGAKRKFVLKEDFLSSA